MIVGREVKGEHRRLQAIEVDLVPVFAKEHGRVGPIDDTPGRQFDDDQVVRPDDLDRPVVPGQVSLYRPVQRVPLEVCVGEQNVEN